MISFVNWQMPLLNSDASQNPVGNDIVYNGNIDQWKRLANSLRLRLGMRLSRIDAATARNEVQAAIAGGVMQDGRDNFLVIHENAAYPDLRGNGYAQALLEEQTYLRTIGCSAFVNYLKREKDPRLGMLFVNRDDKGKDITALTNYLSIAPGLYWWDERADYTAPDGTVIPHNNKYCRDQSAPLPAAGALSAHGVCRSTVPPGRSGRQRMVQR